MPCVTRNEYLPGRRRPHALRYISDVSDTQPGLVIGPGRRCKRQLADNNQQSEAQPGRAGHFQLDRDHVLERTQAFVRYQLQKIRTGGVGQERGVNLRLTRS